MSVIANGSASSNLCLASVVSNNFSQIATAVNSNRLNSENYGVAAVMSQNILTAEMKSSHVSNSQVYSTHFSAVTFRESHVNYKSSDAGARFLRLGPTFASLPAKGMEIARYSSAMTFTSGTDNSHSESWSFSFNQAIDGAPSFITTPHIFAQPYFMYTGTLANVTSQGQRYRQISSINSSGCSVVFSFIIDFSQNAPVTAYAAFIGAASG